MTNLSPPRRAPLPPGLTRPRLTRPRRARSRTALVGSQRGPQPDDRAMQLVEGAVGQDAPDARLELGCDDPLRRGMRGGTGGGQRDHRGAAVARVGPAGHETSALEAVNGLARAADSDRQ